MSAVVEKMIDRYLGVDEQMADLADKAKKVGGKVKTDKNDEFVAEFEEEKAANKFADSIYGDEFKISSKKSGDMFVVTVKKA